MCEYLKRVPQDDVSAVRAMTIRAILLLKNPDFAAKQAILRDLVAGWSAISTYGMEMPQGCTRRPVINIYFGKVPVYGG